MISKVLRTDIISKVIFSRGGSALLQFVAMLFYGAYLTVDEFGYLTLLMIFVGLAYAIIDFGTANTVITNYIGKKPKSTFRNINIINSLIIFFFIFIFQINVEKQEWLSIVLNLTCFSLFLHSFTIIPYARIHKAMWYNILAKIDFYSVLGQFIITITLLFHNYGLVTFGLALVTHSILRNVLIFYLSKQSISFSKYLVDSENAKLLFRQFLTNIITYLSGRIDQIIVSSIVSSELFGTYSFAKQLISYPVSLLFSIYSQLVFPYLSRYRDKYSQNVLLIALSYLCLCIVQSFYVGMLAIVPHSIVSNYIEYWDFSNLLTGAIFIYTLSKLSVDVAMSTLLAYGGIAHHLRWNIFITIAVSLFGLCINVWSLEAYLILIAVLLSGVSIVLFRKLKN